MTSLFNPLSCVDGYICRFITTKTHPLTSTYLTRTFHVRLSTASTAAVNSNHTNLSGAPKHQSLSFTDRQTMKNMGWEFEHSDLNLCCCYYGGPQLSFVTKKQIDREREDSFFHGEPSSHIDLLLLDNDLVSANLFTLHKRSGIMIDVLEAYRRCTACDYPEISDDEDDDGAGYDWSPIAVQKLCVGSRRLRAETVKHTFTDPESAMECENVQVECHEFGYEPDTEMTLKRSDLWTLFRKKLRSDTVIVAVEATAICHNDVLVRQGMLNEDVPLPFVPGSNFVGIVHYSSTDTQVEYGFYEGSRVASLTKWGGNARYVLIPAHQLVPVPKRVDPSEAATVLTTHLPAFQALQHGRTKASRYSPSSLANKAVLITDATSPEGQAAVRLAFWSGASQVYAIGEQHYHQKLQALGATPLEQDPDDWLPVVEGKMDVIVHFEFPEDLDSVQAAMKRKGRLICYARPSIDKEPGYSWMHEIQLFFEQSTLSMIKRSSLYDPIFSFEYYPEQFKRDLKFLFALLVQRQIRPKIDRYITLDGISDAHNDLEEEHVDGAIICEPWKD